MDNLYEKSVKIDQKEFDAIKETLAVYNQTTIDNKDPVLMVYTITRHVFHNYATNLNDQVGKILYNQKEILNDFKEFLEKNKNEYGENITKHLEQIDEKMALNYDNYANLIANNVNQGIIKITKSIDDINDDKKQDNTNNYYLILMIVNIILSFTVLLKILF